eukprot:11223468-Lingulodinium_polyedra.AAC.1
MAISLGVSAPPFFGRRRGSEPSFRAAAVEAGRLRRAVLRRAAVCFDWPAFIVAGRFWGLRPAAPARCP